MPWARATSNHGLVGAIVGWENWFGIFIVTAVIGGIMAIILSIVRGRLKKTLFTVSFILSEMKEVGVPRTSPMRSST